MRVPGSNPTAPILLGVKMAIFGHFWTQNGVLELLGALEPPKRAFREQILLAHGNSGHKRPRIVILAYTIASYNGYRQKMA